MKQNLVYMLTNISIEEGKRFYIGSKQECSIEEFGGVMTILDRNDKPYYSSSTSVEMKEQMKRGDVFEASALMWVKDRKDLLEIENQYINNNNAVHSEEYHNKSNALLNVHDQGAVANKFGETVKELACRNSSMSKRDNTARKYGFENFGEFHLWVKEKNEEGLKHCDISKIIGAHRHFSGGVIKGIDLDKAKREIESKDIFQSKLRSMVASGCSLYYAAELLGLEISSARVLLGNYNKRMEKSYRAALKSGLSKEEMEIKIVQIILSAKDGEGYKQAALELNIGLEAVRRYLSRYLKTHLTYPELPCNTP